MKPAGQIGSHNEPIKSLKLIKESGILISTSLDNQFKFWYYSRNKMLESFKKIQQIYTIDYLLCSSELLIGTVTGSVLTHSIHKFIHFNKEDWPALCDDDQVDNYYAAQADPDYEDSEEEEKKKDSDDDVIKDLNSEYEEILKKQKSIMSQFS